MLPQDYDHITLNSCLLSISASQLYLYTCLLNFDAMFYVVEINSYISCFSMLTKQEEMMWRWATLLKEWLIGGYLQIGHLTRALVRFRGPGLY